MRIELKQVLFPQPKSKIKAGDGKAEGRYKFFTSSPLQTKFHDEANYDEPSLIFGTGGNASVHFCDEPFSTSTDCLVMYGRSRTELETIYNYLKSNIGILENGFKGAGLKHISKDYILAIEIDLPCETIQLEFLQKTRIIDEVIESKRTQLLLNEDLVKSRFIEMFGDPIANEKGWSMHPLEDVCKTIVDCPHSTPNYTNEDTGYMCIRTSIVKKNRILWDDIEYISQAEYQQRIQRKRPEKGDIVYTREGAILGIAAVIDRDCNVALGQRSMLLSPNTGKCLPHFLSVAMNFDSFLNKALGGISGSASPHINVGDIKAFSIILPPIELQRQYVELIEQTGKSKFEIQQSLEKLEILKKSLMQQYFG